MSNSVTTQKMTRRQLSKKKIVDQIDDLISKSYSANLRGDKKVAETSKNDAEFLADMLNNEYRGS
jgi:hypothetical protein